WNLVFMQFEQLAHDERVDLPKPSIDTGMGLERISAVLQGTHDNYETDLFKTLIQASAEAARVSAEGRHAVSHRVIVDHLRASSFLIAEGVMPSNEGRGYVLRRIMRRAMRHAHMMGCQEPLMWQLVPALVGQMGQAFPELVRAEALITETLKLEETRFKQTLDRGLRLLDEATGDMAEGAALPGNIAFKLYDTYGFPIDLTEDVLRGRGLGVDRAGFDEAMERQRAEARTAWSGSGDAATERVWFDIREEHGATEFLGYETEQAEARVIALVVDGAPVDNAGPGAAIAVVVNQTPFYGESGGQAGDSGVISSSGGARLAVTNTEKYLGDLHVHMGTVEGGDLSVGDVVELAVDGPRRTLLRANHSATHLLHAALRRQLGDHVTQKGSLVAADRLRFDFSQPRALSDEDLAAIEADVNHQIRGNTDVTTIIMSPEEAVEHGAMALFGENYGDKVRVLAMGCGEDDGQPYSLELCGGTHAQRTGDIGAFKITSEGAIAAGVRRVEALTGAAALDYLNQQAQIVANAALALKATPQELGSRIDALIEQRKSLERDLAEARRKLVTGAQGTGGDDGLRDAGGVKLSARKLEGTAPKELRGLADDLKKQLGTGVVALIAVNDGKAALVVAVSDDLTDRFSAVDLVRAGAEALGGKGGGGRPDMAQAGGPHGAKADAALDAIEEAIAG
ncbi:MAG: alanine--tRNA ligase, partial [Alphaproteobacteria bacterium]